MSREHELKTWPVPFGEIWGYEKQYEIRKDDRGYQKYDKLILREYDPSLHPGTETVRGYTGRVIKAEVQHVTRGGEWGLPGGLSILGIWLIERQGEPVAAPEEMPF